MDPGVHEDPVLGHGHDDVPDNPSCSHSEGSEVLAGLLPGPDPHRPIPQDVAVALGHLGGQVHVAIGNVQVRQPGLAGHGDDVADEIAVGAQVDAVVGIGVDHAMVGAEENPGSGGDAAGQLGHGGVEALQLGQPLLTEPPVLVTGLVQLADVEVDQWGAAAQGSGSQAGPVLQPVGPQVRGAS